MGISPHLIRAYQLARAHDPHPNPRVGAVVVSPEGVVLGEGSHVAPGEPHAEVDALDGVGNAEGSTVYVSLEPCSHFGRTPPCADRLIAEKVAKVVIGALDPDRLVAGAGVSKLRAAGIEVEVLEDPAARDVDPAYFHHRETGMPLVTAKWAMTLDGSVAAEDGTSQWITSEEARHDAHLLRSQVDGVVVGAGTLRADNPRLDVRHVAATRSQPRAVVVAGDKELPNDAQIWERQPVVISTTERAIPGGELVLVSGRDGYPDPVETCARLGGMGLLHLLLEGGPTLAGVWWQSGVINNGRVYVAAKVGGGRGMSPLGGVFSTVGDAQGVSISATRRLGGELVIDFERGR